MSRQQLRQIWSVEVARMRMTSEISSNQTAWESVTSPP